MLLEFGISGLATYHAPLDVSTVPLARVMNRKKFDCLPKRPHIIRKHSGEWLIASFVDARERSAARSWSNCHPIPGARSSAPRSLISTGRNARSNPSLRNRSQKVRAIASR